MKREAFDNANGGQPFKRHRRGDVEVRLLIPSKVRMVDSIFQFKLKLIINNLTACSGCGINNRQGRIEDHQPPQYGQYQI